MSKTDLPIIIILGVTGSGKSKLAIEVAQKFNGEVISADSMQVYKGLDIITNKVTSKEMNSVPHHFIGFLDPLIEYTVGDFQYQAVSLIDKLLANEKVPIIVGGTNYYIESILWDTLLVKENREISSLTVDLTDEQTDIHESHVNKSNVFNAPIMKDSFKNVSNMQLYEILKEIDHEAALEIHPNDRRKIKRRLRICQQTKRKYSDLIVEQRSQTGGSEYGGPLRYNNCLIFWLQCDKKILDERLNSRVDQMIQKGLMQELIDFHLSYNKHRLKCGIEPDYTRGIFQSIGFKEFHKYLILPTEEQETHDGQILLLRSIDEMKIATRRYAKRQIKWINSRLLTTSHRNVPPVFGLDTSELDQWEEHVRDPCFNILTKYLDDYHIKDLKPLTKVIKDKPNDIHAEFFCEFCERYFYGSNAWSIHAKSKSHQKKRQSMRKRELQKTTQLLDNYIEKENLLNK